LAAAAWIVQIIGSVEEGEAMTQWDTDEDEIEYRVVVNHEEQYSIWRADRENPAGWRDAGKQGRKAECLAYIEQVWTDMRPLSLRKAMAEDQKGKEQSGTSSA
jgi:MbtH protein